MAFITLTQAHSNFPIAIRSEDISAVGTFSYGSPVIAGSSVHVGNTSFMVSELIGDVLTIIKNSES